MVHKHDFRSHDWFCYCLLPNGTDELYSKLPYRGELVCILMNILAALTPNSENSLTLFLVCCNDVLISSVFANIVLFVSRVAATKLSTMFLNVLQYTSSLE